MFTMHTSAIYKTLALAATTITGVGALPADGAIPKGVPGQGAAGPPVGFEYQSPRNIRGAVRSPCPWMNTAANHGFINRSGRQVSVAEFNTAISASLGYAPALSQAITTGMLTKLGVLNGTATDALVRVDIDTTDSHDHTEHDASLTRVDRSQGDSKPVVPSLVAAFVNDGTNGFIDTASVGKSRARVEAASIARGNPPLSDTFIGAAQGEAAQILLAMGDDVLVTDATADARKVPSQRVRTWLAEERFPYELGFAPAQRGVQATELAALRTGIGKAQSAVNVQLPVKDRPDYPARLVQISEVPDIVH